MIDKSGLSKQASTGSLFSSYKAKSRKKTSSISSMRSDRSVSRRTTDLSTLKQQVIRHANAVTKRNLHNLTTMASVNETILFSLQIYVELMAAFRIP